MNRLLLLFVLLISADGLRAVPFPGNKINSGGHPQQVTYERTFNLSSTELKPLITVTDITGLTFDFTIDSIGSFYDTFQWNFGDNTTATGSSVRHTYLNSGSYQVTLTASKGEVKDLVTTYLKAGDVGLEVQLGPDRTICPGQSLNLRGTLVHNGGNYRWNTGDTTWDLNVTAPGQYILVVNWYSRTATDTINITPGCLLKAAFNCQRANNGQLTMMFAEVPADAGTTITGRRWDFGDSTSSLDINPTHTYAAPGNYHVKFWAYDSITHQQDSMTQTVYIMPPVKVHLGNDTTIAAGQSLVLDAADAIGTWSGDAANLWSTGDTSRLLTVNKAGIYTLTVQLYGYAASDTIKVLLDPPLVEPDVSMTYSSHGSNPGKVFFRNTSTLPDVIRTTWYTGDGNSVVLEGNTGAYATYNYAGEGVYQVRMEVLTADHLLHTALQQVRVWPPFNAGNDTTFNGSPMLFKINEPFYSDSTAAVTWYPGGIKAHELLAAAPGEYFAYLTMDNFSAEDTFRVYPPLVVSLGADTTVEQGTALRLDGIAAIGGSRPDNVHFLWSTGDTSTAITVTQPGSYALSVSRYGYTAADTIHIYHRVTPPLKAAYTYSRANNGRLTVNFEAAFTPRAVKYEWNFGDNTFTDTGRVVSHTYDMAASFRVVLTVSDSLDAKDSTSQKVIVEAPIHIQLGPDTAYYGSPIALRINAPYYGDSTVSCIWQPGNISGQQITVNAPGTYYATATQYGYQSTDTVRVREGRLQQPADFSAVRANDGAYTMNFTGMPANGIENVAYSWQFGDGAGAAGKNVSHTYGLPGLYDVYLFMTDSLQHTDTVRRGVNLVPFVAVNLGPDTPLVSGSSIFMDGIAAIGGSRPDNVHFLWSTGDTSSHIKVITPGTYSLTVSMYGRTVADTVVVTAAAAIQVAFHNNAASADRLTQHFYNDSRQGRYPIEKSTWTFDSVTVVSAGRPDTTLPVSYRFPAYGQHTVILAVQDTYGYVSTLTKNIFLQPDTATPVPPVIDSSAAVVAVTDSIPLTYTFPHEFSRENIFTVQLIQSEAAAGGRSATPEIVNINSFPGTDPRISLNVKLPETVPCGKNYRIRIVSSAPADSSVWSQGFEVLNPPAVPLLTQRGDSLESTAAYAYQWFRDGQPVNGATTRSIRAKVNGAYQVQVFSSGDCSTMSAPLSMVITGLADVSLTVSKLKVYPNPSAGAVYVEVEKVPEKPVQADVYNSRGVMVYTLLITEKKTVLDLSAQPRGVYYILPRGAGKEKAAVIVIQ